MLEHTWGSFCAWQDSDVALFYCEYCNEKRAGTCLATDNCHQRPVIIGTSADPYLGEDAVITAEGSRSNPHKLKSCCIRETALIRTRKQETE